MTTFPSILIDRRERHPYTFAGLVTGSLTVQAVTLATGDYTLSGFQDRLTVERKSLADLFATVADRRNAFTRTLARMSRMTCASVVVESPYDDIICRTPRDHSIPAAAVRHFVNEWRSRHRNVRWYFCEGRRDAERLTLFLLQRFHGTMVFSHKPETPNLELAYGPDHPLPRVEEPPLPGLPGGSQLLGDR